MVSSRTAADVRVAQRSFERVGVDELRLLADLAARDLDDRLRRRPRWQPYRERVLSVVLCQGAALHFVDGTTGVKDFDVWTFFAEIPGPVPAAVANSR